MDIKIMQCLGFRHEYFRYPCHQCKASYKNKGHLVRHLRYECGVEPQFECLICLKKFKHKSNLKQHFLLTHGNQVAVLPPIE